MVHYIPRAYFITRLVPFDPLQQCTPGRQHAVPQCQWSTWRVSLETAVGCAVGKLASLDPEPGFESQFYHLRGEVT